MHLTDNDSSSKLKSLSFLSFQAWLIPIANVAIPLFLSLQSRRNWTGSITNKPIAKGEGAPEVARSEVALSEDSDSEDPDWPKDANGNPELYVVLARFTVQVPRRQ